MPPSLGATLTFTGYTVDDAGIRSHFVCLNPGPGQANDYDIFLTDAELAGAQTQAQLVALAQGKLNRLLTAAGLAAKLDLLIGQSLVLADDVGADPTPGPGDLCRVFVSAWSAQALGVELAALGAASPASTVWGTANLARTFPFVIPKPALVRKLWWANGGTVNGNVDVGIYDEGGGLITSSGSVVQAGTNARQEANIADVTLGIGRYYLALASSSATATFIAGAPAALVLGALGCTQQAAAFPLPATGTPAIPASAVLPLCGLALRALVA